MNNFKSNYNIDWLDFDDFKKEFQKVPVEEYPNNVISSIPDPKVSVRITTYQHVEFIREAIESVLVQKTDFPFEIIIGDDDSSDGTREICIEYAQKFPNQIRLFLHKRENNVKVLGKPCGIFQITYNLFKSRSKYIAGCSGDDYWTDPFKLQKQYDFLEAHHEYSYCYHDWRFKYEEAGTSEFNFGPIINQDRTQTLLYKNIFSKIPKSFLSVIQEDTFIKYILNIEGKRKHIPDILPSVCRIHQNNIWGVSRNPKQYKSQADSRINTWIKIAEAFKNTKHEKEIEYRISKARISNIINSPEYGFSKKIYILIGKPYLYKFIIQRVNQYIKKLI